MKRTILFFIVCFSLQLSAQEFHFIPKAGLNIADFTNSPELNSRAGLNIGLGGELVLTPVFSLESGLFYSMQGQKGTVADVKTEFYMDYINLPVYAKCYAYKGLHFFAGPQFGFNVGSKFKMGIFDVSDEVKDAFRKFDLGLGIGAGYQFDLGLVLSASYTYGLIGIAADGKTVNGVTLDTAGENGHNKVFQINVGWRF